MDTRSFGEFVKSLRVEKGLTLEDVHKIANVSISQISRIEKGLRKPAKPEILNGLSKALGVRYEELLERAGYLNDLSENDKESIKDFFAEHTYYDMKFNEYVDRLFLLKITKEESKLIEHILTKYGFSYKKEYRKDLLKSKIINFYKDEDLSLEDKKTFVEEVVNFYYSMQLNKEDLNGCIELSNLDKLIISYEGNLLQPREVSQIKNLLISALKLSNISNKDN